MDETIVINRLEALNLILTAKGVKSCQNYQCNIIDGKSGEIKSLQGYNQFLTMRETATKFRQGYLDWRKRKPKGARGDICTIFSQKIAPRSIPAESTVEKQLEPSVCSSINRDVSFISVIDKDYQRVQVGRRRADSVASASNVEWLRFYFNPLTPFESSTYIKLNQGALNQLLKSNVKVPEYDRNKANVKNWILHIGVGGFHRSHQAVYLDDLLTLHHNNSTLNDNNSWGICGIGLLQSDKKMYDVLQSQDMLYTILNRSPLISNARVVGSILDYVFVPDNNEELLERLKDVKTKIISLTITEKGYSSTTMNNLDESQPNIAHDIADIYHPKSAVGLIVLGLMLRMQNKIQPFTVLSCDNFTNNGDIIRRMVLQFSMILDPKLSKWIEDNVCFPNTMVDRITPILVEEHRDLLKRDYGIDDSWPVVAEEFRLWVIEDSFCNLRPDWESVGVLVVKESKSYEIMKLRLLNGGHTAIAYVSYLLGYRFVDDAVKDIMISSYLRAYMDEVSVTVTNVNIEIERYKDKIVERFSNRFIKDNIQRIAEDGSVKFYSTMKSTLNELLDKGHHVHCIMFGFACWMLYMTGIDENGESIDIKDPKTNTLQKMTQEIYRDPSDPLLIRRFLREVFGEDLEFGDLVVNELRICLNVLKRNGIRSVLQSGGFLQELLRDILPQISSTDNLLRLTGYMT